MEIYNENVHLKEFRTQELDMDKYFSWIRDINVVNTIYRKEYLLNTSRGEIDDYISKVLSSDTDCLFSIHDPEGEFIGTSKIGHINWRTGVADLGILIGDNRFTGKGLSKQVIFLMASYGFEFLSLRKLTGGTVEANNAMIKCFESVGFKKEGVIRQQLLLSGGYQDHILYGCFKEELNNISNKYFK